MPSILDILSTVSVWTITGITAIDIIANLIRIFGGTVNDALISEALCRGSIDISPLSIYLGIGIMMAALLYLIGVMTKRKDYLNYIKDEFVSVLFILLIILTPLILLNCIDVFGVGMNNFTAGKIFWMQSMLNIGMGIYTIQISSGILASVTMLDVMGEKPMQGIWMFIKATLANTLMLSVVAVITAKVLLITYELVTYGFFIYVFPLGLLLRAFPPARRFSMTLIALTIGSVTIMPFVSAAFYALLKDYGFVVFDPNNKNFDMNIRHSWNSFFSNIGILTDPNKEEKSSVGEFLDAFGILPVAGLVLGAAFSLAGLLTGASWSFAIAKIFTLLSLAFILMTKIIVPIFQAVFIFALSSLIILPLTLNSIRLFTGILGEEIDLSSLTRLI